MLPDALQLRLSRLDSLDALRELLAELSYEVTSEAGPRMGAAQADREALDACLEEPRVIARSGEFAVIYAPLRDWKKAVGGERLIISRLHSHYGFALWVFSDASRAKWHLVNVKRGAGKGDSGLGRHILRRFSFQHGEAPGRTSVERLSKIDLGKAGGLLAFDIQTRHDDAFDVEGVTRDFFRDYKLVFEAVEARVKIPDANLKRLWTQRLFNRLMFLRFLEKKGWLEYDGSPKYLRALFNAARAKGEDFLNDRLYFAFFQGLNVAGESKENHSLEVLREIRGTVPFLNGGLFDLEDDWDVRDAVKLPNAAFEPILDLFDRYNFTITESTPFDQEVGVDPEMLGKVFEELVTGRHESGSYYTPRGIVSFMAREALKGFLERIESAQAVARFVDEGSPSLLKSARGVEKALAGIKICDPACGSGAYLLGAMQELLRLREALFAVPTIDPKSLYDLKLEIIEGNIYGVDEAPFAVNIAMLRLWLSLIIEFEGPTPPPLPNLKYKIAAGDSLASPMKARDNTAVREVERQFETAKAAFAVAHGPDKHRLDALAQQARSDLMAWSRFEPSDTGFKWSVEFSEVWAGGGFDIVLANPPYVRHELITSQKPTLKANFGERYSGTADLYVFFYLRAHELLRPGGMLAFISPNKWFRADYGKKLRKYFASSMAVRSITDFGDLPVFESATAYAMVFIGKKGTPSGQAFFTLVKSLSAPYPDVRAVIEANGALLPEDALDGENWNLSDAATSTRLASMRKAGKPLGEYVAGQIYYGVKTGLNAAFVIDEATRLY